MVPEGSETSQWCWFEFGPSDQHSHKTCTYRIWMVKWGRLQSTTTHRWILYNSSSFCKCPSVSQCGHLVSSCWLCETWFIKTGTKYSGVHSWRRQAVCSGTCSDLSSSFKLLVSFSFNSALTWYFPWKWYTFIVSIKKNNKYYNKEFIPKGRDCESEMSECERFLPSPPQCFWFWPETWEQKINYS